MICSNNFWIVGFIFYITYVIITTIAVLLLKEDSQQIILITIIYGLIFWLNSPLLLRMFEGFCK